MAKQILTASVSMTTRQQPGLQFDHQLRQIEKGLTRFHDDSLRLANSSRQYLSVYRSLV
jgi:hypothetical protein